MCSQALESLKRPMKGQFSTSGHSRIPSPNYSKKTFYKYLVLQIATYFPFQFAEVSKLAGIIFYIWEKNRLQLISQMWEENHFIPRKT
jgi:hypothetical protein